MLNFINIGTFFIEFQFSIVGSTETAASPERISWFKHSSLAAPLGLGWSPLKGGGGGCREKRHLISRFQDVLLKDIYCIVQLRFGWVTGSIHYQWTLTYPQSRRLSTSL